MKKALIVIDMQNDFLTGALRNEEGIQAIPRVADRIRKAAESGETVIYTRDTHFEETYMGSEEGKNLPVPHCIRGTKGWEIAPKLQELIPADAVTIGIDDSVAPALGAQTVVIDKPTFGSAGLGELLKSEGFEEVELVGVCTDICVISNALLTKAFLPNAHVSVDPACCAGVTPDSHNTALDAMRACHIEIL
ncbi:MAG: cysteine hydrolase [Lachnospiraceae bacterium]|nr:cysteine hydrolase [Lachnospiraceae bacterium]